MKLAIEVTIATIVQQIMVATATIKDTRKSLRKHREPKEGYNLYFTLKKTTSEVIQMFIQNNFF